MAKMEFMEMETVYRCPVCGFITSDKSEASEHNKMEKEKAERAARLKENQALERGRVLCETWKGRWFMMYGVPNTVPALIQVLAVKHPSCNNPEIQFRWFGFAYKSGEHKLEEQCISSWWSK